MGLHKLTVMCSVLCLAAFAVQLAESQELLQAPTLRFAVDVNQSAVKLYSAVPVVCTIPDTARRPAEVHLSLAANTSSAVLSFTLTIQSPVIFTLNARPDFETALVCWYRIIRTKEQSQFSEPINIVISALSDPLVVLIPPVFPVGAKYTFQCETPLIGYTNTTLSVYDRLLPLRSGNNSFKYVGSRVLNPGEWGAAITRTNTGETYEFLCEMEVFLNGRALRSRSKPIAAMPEELPVRLVPKDPGTCYGDAYVRVRDDWRPLCFVSKFDNTLNTAKVVCKELGCGPVVDYRTLGGALYNSVGTPNCTGNEKKISECPISSERSCDQGTLNVICSEALPPPTLSLSERDTASWVYVRTEESVTLECIFQSSIHEFAYITLTRDGNDLYTRRTLPGSRVTWILHNTVTEGKYACYVHTREFKVYRTESSNVIGIYIYDPPPAGAVAAGVITTIIGVIILALLCIYRTSE